MGRITYSLLAFALLIGSVDIAGCGGGTSSVPTAPPSFAPLSIQLYPMPVSGNVGIGRIQYIDVEGGKRPFTYSAISGSIPNGLAVGLTPDGARTGSGQLSAIYGVPATVTPLENLVIRVTDAESPPVSATVAILIQIDPMLPMMLEPMGPLPAAQAGVPYLVNPAADESGVYIGASGGVQSAYPFGYTWSPLQGTLPPGLVATPSTEFFAINGTPTAAGVYSFTVTAYDSAMPAHIVSAQYSISVTATPTPSPTPSH